MQMIKAVVLRIDSPGGDALASDLMWREIRQLARDKPVVASMVDVAASGGYYMASARSALSCADTPLELDPSNLYRLYTCRAFIARMRTEKRAMLMEMKGCVSWHPTACVCPFGT